MTDQVYLMVSIIDKIVMSEDPRIETIRSMREERDILAKKRKDKNIRYLAKHGKRKDPQTAISPREAELRWKIRQLEGSMTTYRPLKKAELKQKLDEFIARENDLVRREKAVLINIKAILRSEEELMSLKEELMSLKDELLREREALDLIKKRK